MTVNRVLMVAYHYPPSRGSSGVLRTLKFSRYLRDCGWHAAVLTVNPRAYTSAGDDQLSEIPADVDVHRAFALDAARHLSIAGRYPGWFALPDRWANWWIAGVVAGLRMIRKHRPQVLWSTYPIATAHMIGQTLHRLTGIPWVADFRDSMTEEGYPADKRVRRSYTKIEQSTVAGASRVVFTAPGTLQMYKKRYPDRDESHWQLIPNGYDEENFKNLNVSANSGGARRLTFVHSGVLYPSERDPRPFFTALSRLKTGGLVSSADLRVVLRATGHDAVFAPMLDEYDIADLVTLAASVDYDKALEEMVAADGLLIFQASNCNHQIPAKVFEYMRAGTPVFAMTDRAGDTAGILTASGIDTIVALDSADEIRDGLLGFIGAVRSGAAPLADAQSVARYSRRAQTADLGQIFDSLLGSD